MPTQGSGDSKFKGWLGSAALCEALLLKNISLAQQRILAQQSAIAEAEKRATAGLIARALAHDMNNVLAAGMANVELLKSGRFSGVEAESLLNEVAGAFERLHEMTRRLSAVGRRSEGEPPLRADLIEIIEQEIQRTRRTPAGQRCQIELKAPPRVEMPIRPGLMRDIVQNLLINAAEAAGAGGRIEVRVSDGGEKIILEVHDSGPGVPPSLRDRIFDPLYTTKPSGLGLGLLSVKMAVQAHGGRVEVADSSLGGACFRVSFLKGGGSS